MPANSQSWEQLGFIAYQVLNNDFSPLCCAGDVLIIDAEGDPFPGCLAVVDSPVKKPRLFRIDTMAEFDTATAHKHEHIVGVVKFIEKHMQ